MAKAKKTRRVKKAEINLGREGTPARFIREKFLAGEGTGEIVKMAKRKFPKNPINTGYVSWYGTQLRKAGAIPAAR